MWYRVYLEFLSFLGIDICTEKHILRCIKYSNTTIYDIDYFFHVNGHYIIDELIAANKITSIGKFYAVLP